MLNSEPACVPRGKSVTNKKALSTLCCIGLPLLCAAASADEVRFDGQNVMQGELKRLDRGELYFKTPGTDTISIEWNHVDGVSSSKTLEIELDNGDILYASAGVNLTKANNYESYNLGLDLTYTTRKYVSSLDISSHINRSDDTPKAEQSSLQLKSSRKWKKRRYTGGLLAFERNEELGIDLRSSIGISVGKSLKHTNSVDAGLLVTKEEIAGSSDSDNSREAFVGARYEWFRYDDPQLDLTTQLVVIPSLTESGRVRGNFNLTFRWEMIDDLYWRLTYQQDNDSDPPGGGSTKSDYTLFSGIAYDF